MMRRLVGFGTVWLTDFGAADGAVKRYTESAILVKPFPNHPAVSQWRCLRNTVQFH